MQIDAIIDEIKTLRTQPGRKSAADIHRLLEGHQAQFAGKLETDAFRHLLGTFDRLGSGTATESRTEAYKREYDTAYNLLVFYLDKII